MVTQKKKKNIEKLSPEMIFFPPGLAPQETSPPKGFPPRETALRKFFLGGGFFVYHNMSSELIYKNLILLLL